MKKQILVGMITLAASAGAFAATACNNSTATAVPGDTSGNSFVRNGFTPKCSANVMVDYSQTATSMAVASASAKGKNSFKGNTAGGAVSKSAECAASSGCVASDVTTALTAAEAMGS